MALRAADLAVPADIPDKQNVNSFVRPTPEILRNAL